MQIEYEALFFFYKASEVANFLDKYRHLNKKYS